MSDPRPPSPPRMHPAARPITPPPAPVDASERLRATLFDSDVQTPQALAERPGIPLQAKAALDLALKHGIVRGGTLHRYDAVQGAWVQATPAPTAPEAPASAKPPPGSTPASAVEPPEEDEGDADAHLNEFEKAKLRDMLWKDVLQNPDQRAKVEARLPKVDINAVLQTMMSGGYFEQRVPIRKGVYEPVYRQVPYWVEQKLQEMLVSSFGLKGASEVSVQERYAFWGLVCSLVELANKRLPSVMNEAGTDIDIDKFRLKEKQLLNLPVELIASLVTHYYYFSQRARGMLTVDDLGNG